MMQPFSHSFSSVPAPHLSGGVKTPAVMWTVALSLLPALVWGIIVFGVQAALVVGTAVAGALIAELAAGALRGRLTIIDGSAFLTGFIIGLSLPPAVPLFIPLCASVFAVAVVKHAFGGLGANWMNPAMAGRIFVLLLFPAALNAWIPPSTLAPAGRPAVDALTRATPLSFLKSGAAGDEAALHTHGASNAFFHAAEYPVTSFDVQLTQWLNGFFGLRLKPGYFDLFFGNVSGAVGEISVFLLLLGAAVLFAQKIISWEIPVSLLGTFALVMWLCGGVPYGSGFFQGDVIFHLFSGGIVFGAFFVATDYVSGPLSKVGKTVFGFGVGLIAALIRLAGVASEGVATAVIVMNVFVPLIDAITKPKRLLARREETRC